MLYPSPHPIVSVISWHITSFHFIGVILGIVLSALFFASKISKVKVTETANAALEKIEYKVEGQLFFASVTDFISNFKFKQENVKAVEIDLSRAHIWDESGVTAIEKVVLKFHENGIQAHITGLNESSAVLLDQVAVFNKQGGLDQNIGH